MMIVVIISANLICNIIHESDHLRTAGDPHLMDNPGVRNRDGSFVGILLYRGVVAVAIPSLE